MGTEAHSYMIYPGSQRQAVGHVWGSTPHLWAKPEVIGHIKLPLDFTLIPPYRYLKMLGSQTTDQLELTKRLNLVFLLFLVINNPSEALVRKTLPLIRLSLVVTSKDLQLVESQPRVDVLGNVSALARFLTNLFTVCVCQWVWCDLLSVVSPVASFPGITLTDRRGSTSS